jgi:hypothetical protein
VTWRNALQRRDEKVPNGKFVTPETGLFVKPAHSDKCYLRAQGREEFIVYDGSVHNLKRNGHKGGSTMWHTFRCNCLDCDAVAYVRWDMLMVFIAGLIHASKETLDG